MVKLIMTESEWKIPFKFVGNSFNESHHCS
jgi:hypothetical protein